MLRRAPVQGILFASDLPSACEKPALWEIFRDYGPIDDIEIISVEDDFLRYARISYKYVVDAISAYEALCEEELIFGESLKLSWSSPYEIVPLYCAVTPAAASLISPDDLKPPPVHVLFSFISCQVVEQISEQIIAEAFIPFGILTDVNIKKHNTIVDGGYQNGFGFVQYENSWGGVVSALRAVRWFDKKYMGHMTLDAKFGQQFQHFLLEQGILTSDELFGLKSINKIYTDSHQRHQAQQAARTATMDNLFSFGPNPRKQGNSGYNNQGGRSNQGGNYNNSNNSGENEDWDGSNNDSKNRANWPSLGRSDNTGSDGRFLSDLFGYKQPTQQQNQQNRSSGGRGGGRNHNRGGGPQRNDFDKRGGYKNQKGYHNYTSSDRNGIAHGLDPNIFFPNDPIPHPPSDTDFLPGDSLPGDSTSGFPKSGSNGNFNGYGGGWVDEGDA